MNDERLKEIAGYFKAWKSGHNMMSMPTTERLLIEAVPELLAELKKLWDLLDEAKEAAK